MTEVLFYLIVVIGLAGIFFAGYNWTKNRQNALGWVVLGVIALGMALGILIQDANFWRQMFLSR